MKILLRVVASVVFFATFICSSFASSILDKKAALCMETSGAPSEFSKIDLTAVNENFRRLASLKDVDVKALRGDYFEPRKFWEQQSGDIFAALYPTLMKHDIPSVLSCKHRFGCVVSAKNRTILRPLPIDIEMNFEKNVLERINAFLGEKNLFHIGWKEFHASLLLGREKGDTVNGGARIAATPLLTYFEAYYRFKVNGFCGSVKAELLTEP